MNIAAIATLNGMVTSGMLAAGWVPERYRHS